MGTTGRRRRDRKMRRNQGGESKSGERKWNRRQREWNGMEEEGENIEKLKETEKERS